MRVETQLDFRADRMEVSIPFSHAPHQSCGYVIHEIRRRPSNENRTQKSFNHTSPKHINDTNALTCAVRNSLGLARQGLPGCDRVNKICAVRTDNRERVRKNPLTYTPRACPYRTWPVIYPDPEACLLLDG